MIRLLIAVLVIMPFAALTQDVGDCDWRASAQVISEPWEDATATFAEGEVRLTIMDVGEPVVASFYLMIMSPPYGDGGRQCVILGADADGAGFAGLSMAGAKAGYDPANGLSVSIPARRWLPETDTYTDATLTVTINQDNGAIIGQLD